MDIVVSWMGYKEEGVILWFHGWVIKKKEFVSFVIRTLIFSASRRCQVPHDA